MARPRALRESERGSRAWYRFTNRAAAEDGAPSTTVVDLYDEIGGFFGVPAAEFVRDLRVIDSDRIEVHINSPGGDVFDGIAILNALRQHPADVTTVVDGLAASAASFVAMAGSPVVMSRNAEMMIHDAGGFAVGNSVDMRELADQLDRVSDNIASIYADRAGGSPADWRSVMRAETWYTAEEAVAAGLADRVDGSSNVPAESVESAFDLSIFNFAGRSKAPRPPDVPQTVATAGGQHPTEGGAAVALTDEQISSLRTRLGIAEDADGATILTALDEALAERAEPVVPVVNTAPAVPSLPQGTVPIDQGVLNDLRADAAAGRAAREQQNAERREQILNRAATEGRISLASRSDWAAALERDEQGTVSLINSLASGHFAVDGERGYGTGSDNAAAENDWSAWVVPTARKEG